MDDNLEDLIERLRHIQSWDEMETVDRFRALKDAGLLKKSGLEEFSFDAAVEFAAEEGQDVEYVFLTDTDDLDCPYYRYEELRVMEGVELLDNLSVSFPILADHNEDFSFVGRLISTADERKALSTLAQDSRRKTNLATPDEYLTRKSRGRMM